MIKLNKYNVKSTQYSIILAISLSHMFNDMIQSIILAIYPILQNTFHLSFVQIGVITLTYQLTASLLQPVIGFYMDKNPKPFSLFIGMTFVLSGIILLSISNIFPFILLSAALVGTGSSIFHPESTRVASMASGGRHGLSQAILQVGGNLGNAFGPLFAAIFVSPYGKGNIAWFSLIIIIAMCFLFKVGLWYNKNTLNNRNINKKYKTLNLFDKSKIKSLFVLFLLLFAKYFYLASISSYYTFYLIHKFGLSIQDAQMHLFLFLISITLGSIIGGPLGDKFGRKYIILSSIFGATPFTMILPYVSLKFISFVTMVIGFIMASAFASILIYTQELIPGNFGMISGILFGCAFGISGLGAVVLGYIADMTSINFVYKFCAFLPLIGFVAIFLPKFTSNKKKNNILC